MLNYHSIVFCCVCNIVEFKVETDNPTVPIVLQFLGSPSFLCVLGSRMLFHLKEAGERGTNEGTSYRLKTITDIAFN